MVFSWRRSFQLIGLILALCIPTDAFTNNPTSHVKIETFYKYPSYENFLIVTEKLADMHEALKTDPFVSVRYDLYTSFILFAHPEYAPKIYDDFPKLKQMQQHIICRALNYGAFSKESEKIRNKYNINTCSGHINSVLAKELETPEQLSFPAKTDFITNVIVMDYLWSGYYATGNVRYLQTIFQYLINHDISEINNIDKVTEETLFVITMGRSISKNIKRDPSIKDYFIDNARKYNAWFLDDLLHLDYDTFTDGFF